MEAVCLYSVVLSFLTAVQAAGYGRAELRAVGTCSSLHSSSAKALLWLYKCECDFLYKLAGKKVSLRNSLPVQNASVIPLFGNLSCHVPGGCVCHAMISDVNFRGSFD